MEGEEEGTVENTAEDNKEEIADVSENKQPENKPLSSFFSSAWTKVEGFTKSTTTNFAKEVNQDEHTTIEKPQITDDSYSK